MCTLVTTLCITIQWTSHPCEMKKSNMSANSSCTHVPYMFHISFVFENLFLKSFLESARKDDFINRFSKKKHMWNMYGTWVEHDEFADMLDLFVSQGGPLNCYTLCTKPSYHKDNDIFNKIKYFYNNNKLKIDKAFPDKKNVLFCVIFVSSKYCCKSQINNINFNNVYVIFVSPTQ